MMLIDDGDDDDKMRMMMMMGWLSCTCMISSNGVWTCRTHS